MDPHRLVDGLAPRRTAGGHAPDAVRRGRPVHGRGNAAALSGRDPRRSRGRRRQDPPTPRFAIRLVPGADRRGRDDRSRGPSASSRSATTLGDDSRRCDAVRPRRSPACCPEPEAGLAAGILIGLRDAVDRDLAAAFTTAGVSHVVAISGWNIAIVAAAIAAISRTVRASPPLGRHHRRDRRVRRVRGRLAIGRAGRAHGRRRPAGARDRPRGACERGARLGRDPPAGDRSEPDRRRGLPALVAGHGRPHRLGDAR